MKTKFIILIMAFFSLQPEVSYGQLVLRYDDCSKKIQLVENESGNIRDGWYIKKNESIHFEVVNTNTVKYDYKVNHKLIAYHVNFEDYFPVDPNVDPSALARLSCDDIENKLNNILGMLKSLKKNSVQNECLDRTSLIKSLKLIGERLSDEFAVNSFESFYDILNLDACDEAQKSSIKILTVEITQLFSELTNYLNSNKLASLPYISSGKNIDGIKFELTKSSRNEEGKVYTGSDKVTMDYDINIRGGWKIDVSAGLFLTTLSDNKYYLRDSTITLTDTSGNIISQTNLKQIYPDDFSQYSISIGSLVNASYRISGGTKIGFSIGAAIPLLNTNKTPQILGGLTIMFGREYRIGLTGGVVYGAYQKLRNGYQEKGWYELTDNTVPMSTKYKFGGYFGIVYNLGKMRILE